MPQSGRVGSICWGRCCSEPSIPWWLSETETWIWPGRSFFFFFIFVCCTYGVNFRSASMCCLFAPASTYAVGMSSRQSTPESRVFIGCFYVSPEDVAAFTAAETLYLSSLKFLDLYSDFQTDLDPSSKSEEIKIENDTFNLCNRQKVIFF